MAKREEYLTYEQVLQELQINRSQLNQLIREGRLREHIVEGETKFRLVEAQDVKKTLGKRPTVVEEGEGGEEPTTDILEEGATARTREPKTEMLTGTGEGERETAVLEETTGVRERDTEILEEEPVGGELGLEGAAGEELGKPLATEASVSETALETELELKAVGAKPAKKEEEFFDFTEAAEGELELAEAPAERKQPEPAAEEEEEEMVTDILQLGAEEEVPEEDLLSEIVDIEEEQKAAETGKAPEETEEITAEITTLEEPTYDESQLGEVIGTAEAAAEEGAPAAEEFELPVAEPVAEAGEVSVGALPVALLAMSLVVLLLVGIVVVENAIRPELSTHMMPWAP
jgi:hypothetical protein